MKEKIKQLLEQFHNDGIDLHKLQTELLNLNPHHPCESEYDWFKLWILRNIEDYKAGDYYVLSLTSSGSILNCGDDED